MWKNRGKTWGIWVMVTALILALCPPVRLLAQESTGSIEGLVTDPAGAVIPGAAVIIISKQTGARITLTTTGAGVYVARALQPGDYEVRVEAQGFKSGVRDAAVRVGAVTTANFTLEPGLQTEVVTVQAGEEAQVNTVENEVYDVVTEAQIETLPLNGRNFLDLAQLSPGVQIVDAGSFDPTKNGFTGISIGGRS
ncbi:MAG TPA: carboxypeptidase-like regulatory domain-containing protein, partial [Blastocatellia bacterium]|nr:carboxypeptidase-like regulatory domain-containing protein [Blastocatellia bacterium]